MSGTELIDLIVAQCERDKKPPTDGAILNRIRGLHSLDTAELKLLRRSGGTHE